MKKIISLFIAVAAMFVMVCSNHQAVAQTNAGHVFHVVTGYMVGGLDSSARAERNAILKEYFEKVDMKNQYIIHVSNMTHFFSEDSREFVSIYEYASWADIEKAFQRDEELAAAAWPDGQKRRDFMKKMNGYFTHHKDAIYNELPGLKK